MRTPIAVTSAALLLALTACGPSDEEQALRDEFNCEDSETMEECGERHAEEVIAEADERLGTPDNEPTNEEAANEATEDTEPEHEEAPDAVEVSGNDEVSDDGGDLGTRNEPLGIGETAANNEWEASVVSVARDQGGVIAEANQFNEPAPEGTEYALVEVALTYLGDGSTDLWGQTGLTYVTETGETVKASDNPVVTPGELDAYTELYTGGTATGVLAIAVPHDDHGTVRVDIAQTEDWMDGIDEAWFASVED